MSEEFESKFEEMVVGAEGFRTFIFKYRYKDIIWAVKLEAQDAEEAKERIHCLSLYGQFVGEEVYSLNYPRGWGWLAMIIVRIRAGIIHAYRWIFK